MLNGGIVGALLYCHSDWAALVAVMQKERAQHAALHGDGGLPRHLVRAGRTVDAELELWAKAVEVKDDRAIVESTLSANGKVCARCRGTFVAGKPGHPAHSRWS
jgi:hypothetical protein